MKKWKKSIKWRNYSKKLEKKRNNRYNKYILDNKLKRREGSDFYENKNNRKGTKDNRCNK